MEARRSNCHGMRIGKVSWALIFFGIFPVVSVPALAASPFAGAPVTAVGKLPWQAAANFCESQGRMLPSMAQLKEFSGKVMNPEKYGSESWFWTRDATGENYQAIAMGAGDEKVFAMGDKLFTACVDDPARKNKGAPAPKEAIGTSVPGFLTGMAAESANWENADLFCKSQGKNLPTVAQLQTVAVTSGNGSYSEFHWPKGMFWTREPGESGYKLVHLGNGKAIWFPDTDRHWVVCSDD